MGRSQHPLEVHGLQTILDDGVKAEDIKVKDLLLLMLAELKTMNEHLAIISDEEIDTDDNLEV